MIHQVIHGWNVKHTNKQNIWCQPRVSGALIQRPGPDQLVPTCLVSGESEFLSGKQSQVSDGTTLPDIRDRFRTCPEHDQILFVLEERKKERKKRGGQNTSQKNENRGISDFALFHVCFGLAVIQNLLFFFKVNLQDFPDFSLVECHQWNSTSKWCM
jgi:hypothetical protein